MLHPDNFNRQGVWVEEAMHRAANLRQLAFSLQRLLDSGRIDPSNRPRAIRRANALVNAYQSLESVDEAHPNSCGRELRDIAGGLVEIFGHTVGSLVLSLDIQPLWLTAEARRALLLAGSELVINSLRHAFIGRQTGVIQIALYQDLVHQEGTLIVADDGVGPGDLKKGAGLGRGIVRELACVLKGDVSWQRSLLLGGTEVILNFPLPVQDDK
jgi:two-component system, sensor histidine kinase PdtaS